MLHYIKKGIEPFVDKISNAASGMKMFKEVNFIGK